MTGAGAPAPGFAVYLVTDRRRVPRGDLPGALSRVLRAVPPGAVGVQLREVDLGPEELRPLAREVLAAARERGAPLLVNGRALEVAKEIGADGVHLPESRARAWAEGREAGVPGWTVGVSCHDAQGLARAGAFASLAVLGPVFPTPGKAAPGEEMGVERFGTLAVATPLAVYALGGVDAARAPRCVRAGAAGVAVISAVWDAPDPAEALAALVSASRKV